MSEKAQHLWDCMADMFGSVWYERHGEQPTRIWIEAMERLSEREISLGIRRLVWSGAKFPPGLPEFIAGIEAELEEERQEQRQTRMLERAQVASLPSPLRDPDLPIRELAKMRRLLKRKPVDLEDDVAIRQTPEYQELKRNWKRSIVAMKRAGGFAAAVASAAERSGE